MFLVYIYQQSMKSARAYEVLVMLALLAPACRFKYDLLSTRGAPDDSGGSSNAGAAASDGTNGGAADGVGAAANLGDAGEPSTGGSTRGNASGGAGDTTSGGAGDMTSGGADGGETAVGGTSASGGSAGGTSGAAGGGSGTPPDLTLCNQKSQGGHIYLLCKEQRNWADANGGCIAIGMLLVRIDDATENQWLFDNANTPGGSTDDVWIGATDQEVEGEWRWTDGALFWLGDKDGAAQNGLFAGWYSREPNNVSGNENCGTLSTNTSTPTWYDRSCSLALPYACESL